MARGGLGLGPGVAGDSGHIGVDTRRRFGGRSPLATLRGRLGVPSSLLATAGARLVALVGLGGSGCVVSAGLVTVRRLPSSALLGDVLLGSSVHGRFRELEQARCVCEGRDGSRPEKPENFIVRAAVGLCAVLNV